MKKQELIHLHGLLAEVGSHYEDREGESLDLADYEATGVKPTSIHKSKTDHKEAVFALSEGLIEELTDEETTERVAATAD
ncbi:MAG: UPF0058 family protein [Halobacteriaceae archaeon]